MMPRVRPELIKGFGVLGMFLALIVTTSILLPFPISQSEYTFVDLDRVKENPNTFHERNISSIATVESVFYLRPNSIVTTIEDVFLLIRHEVYAPPGLTQGDRIFFRGTFRNNSVSVHEFYELDYSSSIIRSIPGIILFIVMFFFVFSVDFKRLAFVPRRRRNA